MRLKLNNKLVHIKPADNLTVAEYIDFSLLKSIGLIDYLSVVTGHTFGAVADAKLSNVKLRKVNNFIGKIKQYSELLELARVPIFEYENEKYNAKSFDIDKLGYRLMMENKAKHESNGLSLATYSLAVLIEGTFNDAEKVEGIYDKLLQRNYIDTLPYSLFFLNKWRVGSRQGSLLSRILQRIISVITGKK